MRTYAIYLKPRGPWVSEIHSDTLFGAICWAIRDLEGPTALEGMLETFTEHPRFVLSSPFPYFHLNKEVVRLFPKPLLRDPLASEVSSLAEEYARVHRQDFKRAKVEVVEELKKLKGVAWIGERLFRRIVAGELAVHELARRFALKDGIVKVGRALMLSEKQGHVVLDSAFIQERDVQRNQIDRVAGSTVEGLLFFERQIFMRPDIAGLWFLVQTDDLDSLKPALRYLEDTGLGGERTVGKGHFKVIWDRIEEYALPDAGEEADSFITLSRYLPRDGEVERRPPLSYSLVNLRGKHEAKFAAPQQPIYKELVRVFAEGSIFPLRERKPFYGRLHAVGQLQERTVWQNGLSLPVFAKLGGVA